MAPAPFAHARIKLDFVRPFERHDPTDCTLAAQGGATNVPWTVQGPTPFVSERMQAVVSRDSLVGKDFEAGLAKIKAVAEK